MYFVCFEVWALSLSLKYVLKKTKKMQTSDLQTCKKFIVIKCFWDGDIELNLKLCTAVLYCEVCIILLTFYYKYGRYRCLAAKLFDCTVLINVKPNFFTILFFMYKNILGGLYITYNWKLRKCSSKKYLKVRSMKTLATSLITTLSHLIPSNIFVAI